MTNMQTLSSYARLTAGMPAVKWTRAMWRFFDKHHRGTVGADVIERYTSCMADSMADTPRLTFNAAHRAAAMRKAKEKLERKEHAKEVRRNVETNTSRHARASHGNTRRARQTWCDNQNRRIIRHNGIDERLSSTAHPYAFPSRNLQPLHIYLKCATKMANHTAASAVSTSTMPPAVRRYGMDTTIFVATAPTLNGCWVTYYAAAWHAPPMASPP